MRHSATTTCSRWLTRWLFCFVRRLLLGRPLDLWERRLRGGSWCGGAWHTLSQVFKSYDQKDAVLAAGSGGNDDTQQVDGLVQGHGEHRAVWASGITPLWSCFFCHR